MRNLAGNACRYAVVVAGHKTIAQIGRRRIQRASRGKSASPRIDCGYLQVIRNLLAVSRSSAPRTGIATVIKERGRKHVLNEFRTGGGTGPENSQIPIRVMECRNLKGRLAAHPSLDGKFLMPAAFQDGIAIVKQYRREAVKLLDCSFKRTPPPPLLGGRVRRNDQRSRQTRGEHGTQLRVGSQRRNRGNDSGSKIFRARPQ